MIPSKVLTKKMPWSQEHNIRSTIVIHTHCVHMYVNDERENNSYIHDEREDSSIVDDDQHDNASVNDVRKDDSFADGD